MSSSAEEEHSGSPRQPDEIFIHDNGSPIAFWVQMETKQRGDLVQMIKASSVANVSRATLMYPLRKIRVASFRTSLRLISPF